ILFSLYAMGRDANIWGEDYLEFKPERWISERGGIVYAPSYKFFSFNAGPRTCLGRDLAFIQIKMIAASVLWNYGVHVVDVNQVAPNLSIVLLMKHGLKERSLVLMEIGGNWHVPVLSQSQLWGSNYDLLYQVQR
ncbi:cytochrome p450 86b1-like protein, partial [Trifolium pratense]